MKKPFPYIILFCILISFSSCFKFLIVDRFIEKEPEDLEELKNKEAITFDWNNFFILKTFKSKSNLVESSTRSEYADFEFNVFEQVTDGYPISDDKRFDLIVAEENYLYLDSINQPKQSWGRAIYFNTYHLLFEKYQIEYLNQEGGFYSGIIKDIKIGYWFFKDGEVTLYFESKYESDLMLSYKGVILPDSTTNRKVFLMKKSNTVASATKKKDIAGNLKPKELVTLFDRQSQYLNIKEVFDLQGEEGLHYKQMKNSRKFLYYKFDNKNFPSNMDAESKPIISQIIWGEKLTDETKSRPEVYWEHKQHQVFFKTKDGIFYEFKKKAKSKQKKDRKYFSILELDFEIPIKNP